MLFSPASGYRDFTTGALSSVGTIGDYWSSAPYAAGHANGGVLYSNSDNVGPLNGFMRAYGFPVRCVQHLQLFFIFLQAAAFPAISAPDGFHV